MLTFTCYRSSKQSSSSSAVLSVLNGCHLFFLRANPAAPRGRHHALARLKYEFFPSRAGYAPTAEVRVSDLPIGITFWFWVVLEVGLRTRDRVRGKGTTGSDRGTRMFIGITIIGATVVAQVAATTLRGHTSLRLGSGTGGWQVSAGLVMMWLGLAVRIWAVVVLGGAFRTTVEVDPDQQLVDWGRTAGSAIPPTPASCWPRPGSGSRWATGSPLPWRCWCPSAAWRGGSRSRNRCLSSAWARRMRRTGSAPRG